MTSDSAALANKSRADNDTDMGLGHREPLSFCEIGLCIGGPEFTTDLIDRTVNDLPSIKMYIPNAKLYGVDISDFSASESDRFKFVRTDAGDEKQLQKGERPS
jgi:hypothetical protein